ncbi:MAG: phosphoribosylamine--glycine ligase [Bdellovibrionota bacterium]
MKLLVVGGGGREHAIAWRLSQDQGVEKVFLCPGNPGIAQDARLECTGIGAGEFDRIAAFAKDKGVGFVVVGPDQALADGAVDYFESRALAAFGPSKQAAKIEWSKAYSKDMMRAAGIPTAAFETFTDPAAAKAFLEMAAWGAGWVVKADGLALGKGVVVCASREEALQAAADFLGGAHKRIVVEELVSGREVSAFFLCDGETAAPLGMACDYKRISDGDQGANTGGMGAFTPADWLPSDFLSRIGAEVTQPLLRELKNRGNPFKGVLFIGLMVDGAKFNVLEFNARFGDPETQALLPMLAEDLYPWLRASRDGRIGNLAASGPKLRGGAAVHVVSAAEGYPGTPRKGDSISVDPAFASSWEKNGVKLFYAGVARSGSGFSTNGGRVLGITALGATQAEARAKAYEWSAKVKFAGMQRRGDVGK